MLCALHAFYCKVLSTLYMAIMCLTHFGVSLKQGKSIGFVCHCLSSSLKSPDLDIQVSETFVSITNKSNSVKNQLKYASNRLVRPMNVTKSVYLLAIVDTPVDRAYCRPCVFCSCAQVSWYRDRQMQAYIAVGQPYLRPCKQCRCQVHTGYVLCRALVMNALLRQYNTMQIQQNFG